MKRALNAEETAALLGPMLPNPWGDERRKPLPGADILPEANERGRYPRVIHHRCGHVRTIELSEPLPPHRSTVLCHNCEYRRLFDCDAGIDLN